MLRLMLCCSKCLASKTLEAVAPLTVHHPSLSFQHPLDRLRGGGDRGDAEMTDWDDEQLVARRPPRSYSPDISSNRASISASTFSISALIKSPWSRLSGSKF